MARIRIEDLPPDTELTPEELEQIYGGTGRRSFRPTIETLEGREMYAANVTATLTAGVLHVGVQHVEGTPQNDVVSISRVGNQIQVFNGPTKEAVGRPFDAAQVKSWTLAKKSESRGMRSPGIEWV